MPELALFPAAVIAALLAMVFILAYDAFGNAFVQWLHVDVPYIGDVIADLVEIALDGAYVVIAGVMDYIIQPAENMILYPINAIRTPINAIISAIEQTTNAILTITTVTIPSAVSVLSVLTGEIGSGAAQIISEDVDAAFTNVETEVTTLQQRLSDGLTAAFQAEAHDFDALLNMINAETPDLGALQDLITSMAGAAVTAALPGIEAEISAALNSATGYADTLTRGVEADIANALSTAEVFTSTAIHGIQGISSTDIDNIVAGALGAITTELPAAVTGAIDTAGDWGADVIEGLRDIPIGRIGSIAGIAALAGATTLSFARYLEECGIPNCRNLSQYGKDLQDLLGVVGDASFLALLVELIDHPGNAAATFNDTFGSIVSAGESLTHELLNI